MTEYVPKESERSLKPKLVRRAKAIRRAKDSRMLNLTPGWWLKRPKEEGADVPAMERLVGPVAYRGRQQMIQRKTGKAARPMGGMRKAQNIMSTDLSRKGIPHNTRRSEKQMRSMDGPNRPSGPRRPS